MNLPAVKSLKAKWRENHFNTKKKVECNCTLTLSFELFYNHN